MRIDRFKLTMELMRKEMTQTKLAERVQPRKRRSIYRVIINVSQMLVIFDFVIVEMKI